MPSRTSLFQPAPALATSALGVRQTLLAQVALHALSPAADEPMAVLLPPTWDPGADWRAAEFFQGLDVPWIQPGSLTGLLDRGTGGAIVDPDRVTYPESEAEAELPAYLVASTQRVFTSTATLQDLLTARSSVIDPLDEMALLGTSTWSRHFPASPRNVSERSGGWSVVARPRAGPRTLLRHRLEREGTLPGHHRQRPRPAGHRGAPHDRDRRHPRRRHP